MNTFEQLQSTMDCGKVGYYALKSWGFTFKEAKQEALIALWDISKGEDVKSPSNYLIVKLRNKQIDLSRRKKKKLASVECLGELEADEPYDLSGFMETIKPLPEDRRELLFYRYVGGHSIRELSEMYGVEAGTIKSRLSRSQKLLGQGFNKGDK